MNGKIGINQRMNKSNGRRQVKISSLGGFAQVNRNMYCYEYGNDIVLVDCGIGFPTEEMLGVDLLIPDISYLKDKQQNIRGMVLTHGHEDHIGGLPYILPKLPNFPVYGARLTNALAKEKLKEYNINRKLIEIDGDSEIRLGEFILRFARVSHSIPDTMHIMLETPVGTVYHGADYKFDFTPVDGIQPQLSAIAAEGDRGIKLLLSDCLGSERRGATPSEITLNKMFDRELADCKGKFVVTTMSSSISRLQQAIDASIRHGRKVVLSGRSLEKNVRVAMELGYLNIDKEHIVDLKRSQRMKDHHLTYLVAGSQGQEGSALYRIAVGDHHHISVKPGDKVLFSTDYIPGSELAIHQAIDNLYQRGVDVVYREVADGLHVSGHGGQEDMKLLINLTDPEYFYPIGGQYKHIEHYKKIVEKMGYAGDTVMIPGGRQVVMDEQGVRLGDMVSVRNVMVDGLGVGDVGNVVLRDRQMLAEDGIVVAIIQIDSETKQLVDEPDIISRGLVYTKSGDGLMPEAKKTLYKALDKQKSLKDWHLIKKIATNQLQRFFMKKLERQPMILPVVMEV